MLFGNGTGGVDWVLVCLGNPGEKYENTRHNVGFMVADELGERQHAPIQRLKYKALTNVFTISGQKVLVMKPVTFMNLSGEAVRQAVDFYKVAPDHVLVVSDDTALAVGRLRIRRGGSAGGHNGLKNIILHLGTDQFPRLRVGVGEKPHPDYDMADWVLGKFQGEDKKAIDQAVKRPPPWPRPRCGPPRPRLSADTAAAGRESSLRIPGSCPGWGEGPPHSPEGWRSGHT